MLRVIKHAALPSELFHNLCLLNNVPSSLKLSPCQYNQHIWQAWYQHKSQHTNNPRDVPDSKVHGANICPTWVLSSPDGPHVGPMTPAIMNSYAKNSLLEIGAWISNDIPQFVVDVITRTCLKFNATGDLLHNLLCQWIQSLQLRHMSVLTSHIKAISTLCSPACLG